MRHRDALTDEQRHELDALDRALAGAPVDAELRELEELVRDVRATAPEMSPAFAARLEHEVGAGFPTPRERPIRPPLRGRGRRPWTDRTSRRWVLVPAAGSLAALLVALVVVLGPGGNGDDITAFSGKSSPSEQASPAAGVAEDSAAGSAGGGAADRATSSAPAAPARSAAPAAPSIASAPPIPSSGAVAPARTRKVQRSAVLSLRTSDARFAPTTDAVIATVGRFDGIVASSQIGASDAAGGEASFDLRIPTERLDRALAALSKLGHVTERSQSLQDITANFASAQERLSDARAERRGLLRALARATTQNQINAIKAQLRTVSSRIAGAKGELSSLRRRADFARVDLTVRGGGESGTTGGLGGSDGGAWTPGDAAGDALRVLEVLAGVALVGLAVLLPLALLGTAVGLGVRAGRRRRRESALDPA